MAALGRSAPLVDHYFIDPLRAAWGVGVWLRDVELEARDLIAATDEAQRGGNRTTLLHEVSGRLMHFVENDRGILYRLLRRPLSQLKQSAPARIAAERSIAQLFSTARAVIALHPAILMLQHRLIELRDRFGQSLPHIMADHFKAAEIGERSLAGVRTAADVSRFAQRLSRVASVLDDFEKSAAASPVWALADDCPIDVAIPITRTELLGYRESALRRRRNQSTGVETFAYSASLTAAATLAIIDAQSSADLTGASLAAAPVERIAVTAVNSWAGGPTSEATRFVVGLLTAGANGLLPTEGRFVWRPPIGTLRGALGQIAKQSSTAEVDDSDGSTFYSIPIGKDYVLFSRKFSSVVRLYSRTLRIGEVVECTARPVGDLDTPPASGSDFDLQRQFVGLDQAVSRWYKTAKRTRIRVFARCGDEWYGRIEAQGELEMRPEPGASNRSPGASAFRVLRGPISSAQLEENLPSVEAMVTGPPIVFLGLRSVEVATPFSEQRRGMVRSFSGRSRKGFEAVQREQALLTELDVARKTRRIRGMSSVATLGLVSLPRPRNVGRNHYWPCYSLPLAGWELEYDRTWIQTDLSSTFAMLGSVSRTICIVNDLGFSLGAIGFQSFAIGIGWRRPQGNPRPEVTLVTAPLACRLGDKYHYPTDPGCSPERHRHIRVPLVAENLERKKADRTVDVRAFSMFALDLLVRYPTTVDHTETSIIDAAAQGDLEFTFPIAERLLIAMSAPDSNERLLNGMKVLADPRSVPCDWIAAITPG